MLHQYDVSPFSEKVRVCLGIKGLAWQSVDQPVIMPKPDLVALTGGYRRIPVMQIGADIYCDSALIARELERRYPSPSLFPTCNSGTDQAAALWTDRSLFQAAMTIAFAALGPSLSEELIRDREAMSGHSFDRDALKAAAPHMAGQLRAHAALLEEQLADGRPFLLGDRAGFVDACAFYSFWFVETLAPSAAVAFSGFTHLRGWIERIRAVGHGSRSVASRDDAIAAARSSQPEPCCLDDGDKEFAEREVAVMAMDTGRDPAIGILVGSSQHHVSLRREDERAGTVVVHLPRIGYALRPASPS